MSVLSKYWGKILILLGCGMSVLSKHWGKILQILIFLGCSSILIFMYWEVPTRMRIDFTVDKITFNAAENINFNLPEFSSIKFISFSNATVELNSNKINIYTDNEVLESVLESSKISIKGSESEFDYSSIEVKDILIDGKDTYNLLDLSIIKDSKIEIFYEDNNLFIDINYPEPKEGKPKIEQIEFNPIEDSQLSLKIKFCETEINNREFNSLLVKDILSNSVTVNSTSKISIVLKNLNIEKKEKEIFNLFSRKSINSINTSDKLFDSDDDFITTVKKGKISYPDYPNVSSVNFEDDNIVLLGKNTFYVKQFQLEPEKEMFNIRLYGIAEERVGLCPEDYKCGDESGQYTIKDYRLTRYDTYGENRLIMAIVDIATWLIPILIGVFITINVKLKE